MGVGKTTVGRLVARELDRPFVDLDRAIEAAAGASPAEIFRRHGEAHFRDLERRALEVALDARPAAVVALGGGTLVDEASRAEACRRALLVALSAPLGVLLERLGEAEDRPLLAAASEQEREARLTRLLSTRGDAYATAHATVDATRPVEEVASTVAKTSRDRFELVTVDDSPYAVRLSDAPWDAVAETLASARATKTFLFFDETVEGLFGDRVRAALAHRGVAVAGELVLPPGEEHKRLSSVERGLEVLAAGGADRRSMVVAIGGGVTSDLAGFTAAIFVRGLRWIAVPTTLLSMVDASIGGKTGVDFAGFKNLVGSFHQPAAVIVSPGLSGSETDRARRSGLAELVKSLAVGDPEALRVFEALVEARRVWGLSTEDLVPAVWASVRVKSAIVSRDPRERGERAFLNFGHTLGHALESFGGFARWTHGEAVAVGMAGALAIGRALGITPAAVEQRLLTLLHGLGLETRVSEQDLAAALPLVRGDKKRQGDEVRFVVLRDLGKPEIVALSFEELSRHAREMYP